jgi:hypothetical protein
MLSVAPLLLASFGIPLFLVGIVGCLGVAAVIVSSSESAERSEAAWT